MRFITIDLTRITSLIVDLKQYTEFATHEDDITNMYIGECDKVSVSHRSGRTWVESDDREVMAIVNQYKTDK